MVRVVGKTRLGPESNSWACAGEFEKSTDATAFIKRQRKGRLSHLQYDKKEKEWLVWFSDRV
ncbi:MAG: hypothetical protein ACW99U_15975 [Candidatus Thorarchaeota archaeon]